MEAGVKNSDLRNLAKKILNDLHALKFRAHFRRDDHGIRKMRTTMDHTVADGINVGRRGDGFGPAVHQGAQQVLNDLLARGNRQVLFEDDPLRVLRLNLGAVAIPFDLTFPQTSGRMLRETSAYFVEAGFLTTGTGIEDKNF